MFWSQQGACPIFLYSIFGLCHLETIRRKKKKSHLIFESSFLQIQEYLWISEESFILKLCEIMKYNLDKQPPFNIFKPGALKTFSLQENTMPRVKVVILCLVTILLYFAHYKFSLNTIEVLVEKRKKKRFIIWPSGKGKFMITIKMVIISVITRTYRVVKKVRLQRVMLTSFGQWGYSLFWLWWWL